MWASTGWTSGVADLCVKCCLIIACSVASCLPTDRIGPWDFPSIIGL